MKLVILDRDGVINLDSDDYIKSAHEWIPIPGSLDAISKLSRAGYTVVVATNQSGIARGYYDINTLHEMHMKMDRLLGELGGSIDAVFFCPHAPKDKCSCRKPQDGLFQRIADRYQVRLSGVPAIGDSLRDLQTAITVGARPILVRTGKGQKTEQILADESMTGVSVYDDLACAVDAMLEEQG